MITIWTVPGSSRHCELCDAFLDLYGFVVLRDQLHEVVTMAPAAARDRTRWQLRPVQPAGAS